MPALQLLALLVDAPDMPSFKEDAVAFRIFGVGIAFQDERFFAAFSHWHKPALISGSDLAQIESNRLNNEKNLICIKAALGGFTTRNSSHAETRQFGQGRLFPLHQPIRKLWAATNQYTSGKYTSDGGV
jgi:hypothetical protein